MKKRNNRAIPSSDAKQRDAIIIQIEGHLQAVQVEVAEIIDVMKTLNGVEITGAGLDPDGLYHVAFQGSSGRQYASMLLMLLGFPEPGTPAVPEFEVLFDHGSCCMRWSPASYWLVLEAAKQVPGRLRDGREREQVGRSRGTT